MQNSSNKNPTQLLRRGFDLGLASAKHTEDSLENWSVGKPVLLMGKCTQELKTYTANIEQSDQLYQAVLEAEVSCEELFDEIPYIDRLEVGFESLGSSFNEGDDQEIETVLFDATSSDTVVAEDLWMKASWLSFYEEDASLRFRFSFGVDLHEDVAADKNRQKHSALLAEAVFPESRVITAHSGLIDDLCKILQCDRINFVERIVYFNAPQGGAYLHHDRERGHAGVVYAQLSGQTYWLALPRMILVEEIISFVELCQKEEWPKKLTEKMQTELIALAKSKELLAAELESFCNETLIHLINETQGFVNQLITNGHSRKLSAGDVILLPQETEDNCCWHSVFTLGDSSGQALSFAIRGE